MSDLIAKALRKLTEKERTPLRSMLEALEAGKFEHFDVKKLKGRTDIYRLRKGKLRVICRRTKDGENFILAVERRSDMTHSSM